MPRLLWTNAVPALVGPTLPEGKSMIQLTRLNNECFTLNTDLIERIEAMPDTVLTLIDGTKYLVSEPVDEVIELVIRFRARVVATSEDARNVVELHLVNDADAGDE